MCVVGLSGVMRAGAVFAAQDAPTPKDEPIRTLHVYANLIQIPTLVLGLNRERLKTPIAESRFSVSIHRTVVSATHVRLEGDDPISLSILLDVSGNCGVDGDDGGAISALRRMPSCEGSCFNLRAGLFAGAVVEETMRLRRVRG